MPHAISISLPAETVCAVWRALLEELARVGARTICLVTGHYAQGHELEGKFRGSVRRLRRGACALTAAQASLNRLTDVLSQTATPSGCAPMRVAIFALRRCERSIHPSFQPRIRRWPHCAPIRLSRQGVCAAREAAQRIPVEIDRAAAFDDELIAKAAQRIGRIQLPGVGEAHKARMARHTREKLYGPEGK